MAAMSSVAAFGYYTETLQLTDKTVAALINRQLREWGDRPKVVNERLGRASNAATRHP